MKQQNVFLLPTTEETILHYDFKLFTSKKPQISNTINSIVKGHNLYIVSNDTVMKGDYTLMLDSLGNLFCNYPQQFLGIEKGHHWNKGLRKIVFTTDLELIKNGVKPIQDDFISLYIKEPIDYVKIDYITVGKCNCECHKPNVMMIHCMPCCYPTSIPVYTIPNKMEDESRISVKNFLDSFEKNKQADSILSINVTISSEDYNNLLQTIEKSKEIITESIEQINDLKYFYDAKGHCETFLQKAKNFLQGRKK